jgi:hypothetical protein
MVMIADDGNYCVCANCGGFIPDEEAALAGPPPGTVPARPPDALHKLDELAARE